jgi:glycosyltransferase involved in cell wall biosynthesis
MATMTTLSIIIPAYNEEDGIAEIANRVLAVREALIEAGVSELELVVVDDGSKDRTAEIARQVDGVTLISHPINRGYGAALKTGFAHAKGDVMGFLDADGTYPPEYFPKLFRKLMEGYDLVIGSRMAGASSEMPLVRRIGNSFFAGMISILGRQKITDSASGMRLFRRDVLPKVYPLPDGLNLTPIMTTRALHEDVLMIEVPIPYSERVGRSKLSVIRDGSVYLQSITWTVLTYNPVRILGALGIVGLALALAVMLGLLFARLGGTTQLGPWGVIALFTAMVAGISGISLFSLGITFNYLVSLFYKRPIRQGLFGKPIFSFPLDYHFGWVGLVALLVGLISGAVSMGLSLSGWEITRLWFYMLASAMAILVGVQLIIFWILLRALDEISKREIQSEQDLQISVSVQ